MLNAITASHARFATYLHAGNIVKTAVVSRKSTQPASRCKVNLPYVLVGYIDQELVNVIRRISSQ